MEIHTVDYRTGEVTTEMLRDDALADFLERHGSFVPAAEVDRQTVPTLDVVSAGRASEPGPAPANPNTIFPPDDRTLVADPWLRDPYDQIASVSALWATGTGPEAVFGTAALINQFQVLTAGHLIYDIERGGFADTLSFRFAQDRPGEAPVLPFDEISSTKAYVMQGWAANEDPLFDIALVSLDRSLGNAVGWFGIETDAAAEAYIGQTVTTAGYPADLDGGARLYEATGEVAESTANVIGYRGSLDTGRGQSGAPVWTDANTLIGVHARGAEDLEGDGVADDPEALNEATRILPEFAAQFDAWFADDLGLVDDRPELTDYDALFGTAFSYISGSNPTLGQTNFDPGEAISVSLSVWNQGTVAAEAYRVNVYLSTNQTITLDDVPLGGIDIARTEAGGTSTIIWEGVMPDLAAGTYYVGWIIDPENAVAEYDQQNNTGRLSDPITVTAGGAPDLAVEALALGATTWEPGDRVSVSWELVNQGARAAQTSASALFLSDDPTITVDDTPLLTDADSGPLAPGARNAEGEPNLFTVPDGLAPGTYYVGAVADIEDTVAERDETNNATPAVAVEIRADDFGETVETAGELTIGESVAGAIEREGDRDWFAIDLLAGQDYVFELKGAETGDGSLADPELRLLAPDGTPITGDDDSGAGENARIELVAPENGTFFLSAGEYLDNATGSYRLSAQVPQPDLIVEGFALGAILWAPGATISASWAVANLGSAGAIDTAATLYLSSDPEVAVSDRALLTDPSSGPIEPGGSAASGPVGAFQVPADLAPGTYYAAVLADPDGAVAETDEGNNLSAVIAVEVFADDYGATPPTAGSLEIGGTESGVLEVAGDRDWFAVELVAGGEYVFEQRGLASEDGTLADPELRLYGPGGALIDGNDNGGTGTNARLDFIAPEDGTYFLAAGEYLDNATGSYTVAAREVQPDRPDLIAEGLALSAVQWEDAQNIAVAWEIVNLGTAPAPATATTLYLSDDPTVTVEDTPLLSDGAVPALAPGARADVGQPNVFRVPVGLEAGTYYVAAIADVTGGALESAEANNVSPVSEIFVFADDFGEDAETAGVLPTNGAVTGVIEQPGDRDWFAVDLIAGRSYAIEQSGETLGGDALSNPEIRIYDATDRVIDGTTGGGPGSVAEMTFVPSVSGRYYIEAGQYLDTDTGGYMLALRETLAAAPPPFGENINIDGAISRIADTNGGRDTYTVLGFVTGDVEIIDNDGAVINLPNGLAIDSLTFAQTGVRIETGSGTVTILTGSNAELDLLEFRLGGTPLDPAAGLGFSPEGFAAVVGAPSPDTLDTNEVAAATVVGELLVDQDSVLFL
ncbi:MAG: CARDB domain-containing protein [Paracoccaceae bacterium]